MLDRLDKNCLIVSDVTKQKLSKRFNGVNHPFYGRHHNEQSIEQMREKKCIPVLQFDLDGNFIAEYKSAKHAVDTLGVQDKSCISKCCIGQRKTAHGYIWKYKNIL